MAVTCFQKRLVLCGLCLLFYATFTLEAARSWNERNYDDLLNQRSNNNHGRSRKHRNTRRGSSYGRTGGGRNGNRRSDKPNIILVITDDQDELLGSMNTMEKTMKIMGQEGIHFNNSFVSTPMCCPSRSSLLTGMYPHNHHVYTNNDNCSGTEWQREHEPRTFAKYLSDAGYRTGFFGKYLNEYNGTYIPPGWREWVGLVKNSRFYNYTLNFNGQKVKHDDNYYRDYFTDLIANDSVTFLKQSKQYFQTKPVMMMLSVPAPHGPEDSAPQFQHMFENNTLHRTPSWNYMNNSDKQWLVKEMKPMEPIGMAFTDLLHRKRLQTLQSVDSLMEKLYDELRLLGELDNTYIIYTSDHGYHLGQFGILKGKALPYDFDIRVPLYIRGPGVLRDTNIPNVVGNVDIAPTILDMAGVSVPDHMDGRSLLKLMKIHKQDNNVKGDFIEVGRPWRDTVLIERGKVTSKIIRGFNKKQDDRILSEHSAALLPYVDSKMRKTLRICGDPNNEPPCKFEQKWVCFKDERGRQRTKKCRNYNKTMLATNDYLYQRDAGYSVPTGDYENQKCIQLCASHQERLNHTLRQKQDLRHSGYKDMYDSYRSYGRKKRSYEDEEMRLRKELIAQQLSMNRQRCRFLNETLICDKELTKDPAEWEKNQQQLDEMIEETKRRLRNLKKLRKHMKRQRKRLLEQYDDNNSDDTDYNIYGHDDDFLDEDDHYDYDDEDDGFDSPDYVEALEDCKCEDIHLQKQISSLAPEDTGDIYGNSREADEIQYYPKGGKKQSCNHDALKCSVHTNDHWTTPPYWTLGPLCFCTNAVQNTYWCLRTVNTTHDFLYCEFIDSFLAFYDFKTDPYQLHNVIKTLDFGVMEQLHKELTEIRKCQGWKQCNKKFVSTDSDTYLEKRRKRKKRKVRRHTRQRKHKRVVSNS